MKKKTSNRKKDMRSKREGTRRSVITEWERTPAVPKNPGRPYAQAVGRMGREVNRNEAENPVCLTISPERRNWRRNSSHNKEEEIPSLGEERCQTRGELDETGSQGSTQPVNTLSHAARIASVGGKGENTQKGAIA